MGEWVEWVHRPRDDRRAVGDWLPSPRLRFTFHVLRITFHGGVRGRERLKLRSVRPSPLPFTTHPFHPFTHSTRSPIPPVHPFHPFTHSTHSPIPPIHPFHPFHPFTH